ncbi:nudix hydrolase 7 [Hyalella azteca]|uniref:Nudix hydrolase 7 n=1 Tax=Hyalella azteca TaxID=294128 RepID=A0A8B7N9Y8_HYAAZ|nr:nudix hydrolase 7 [Hyalella azteca]
MKILEIRLVRSISRSNFSVTETHRGKLGSLISVLHQLSSYYRNTAHLAILSSLPSSCRHYPNGRDYPLDTLISIIKKPVLENITIREPMRKEMFGALEERPSAAAYCVSTTDRSMTSHLNNPEGCLFQGKRDRYGGVIVSSQLENRDDVSFEPSLTASLEAWTAEGVRGVWFEIHLLHTHWVPVLAKHGFVFHHGEDSEVVMVRWLPTDAPSTLPRYAHTVVGVGAMVVREDSGQLLVVEDKYCQRPHWKLPGGYVERGEDLSEAAAREVLEETGVRAELVSVVATRHMHKAAFGCCDLYFVVLMRPTSTHITMCTQELNDCRWMNISEYAEHPLVHETNRLFVQCYLQSKEYGASIRATPLVHSVTNRQQIIYSIDHGSRSEVVMQESKKQMADDGRETARCGPMQATSLCNGANSSINELEIDETQD